jgi:hypothetical protein
MNKNILVGLLLLLALFVGFIIGRSNIPTPLNGVADSIGNTAQETADQTNEPAQTNQTNTEGAVNISSNLTDGQRKMLESFGLNPDEVTITPAMIACAEAKLGAPRIAEIEAGATPSLLEGASLVACYK